MNYSQGTGDQGVSLSLLAPPAHYNNFRGGGEGEDLLWP